MIGILGNREMDANPKPRLGRFLPWMLAIPAFGYSLWRLLSLTSLYWGKGWPVPALTIDGQSYLDGAKRIDWGESVFSMQDIYHSPGYQIFLSLLLKAAPGSLGDLFAVSKVISILCFILCTALTYTLGRKYFSPLVGLAAAAIFSLSLSWAYYCNMIQYEVILGTLMLVWLILQLRFRERGGAGLAALLGGLLVVIVLFNNKYSLLVLLPAWDAIDALRKRFYAKAREQAVYLFAALAPLAAWSVSQSVRLGHLVWVMDRREWLFHLGNNPNAFGAGFPHPPVLEPSGWAFLWQRPGQFLWLVGQRFAYLWGIKPDVWQIPPENLGAGPFYQALKILGCMAFFCGFGLWLAKRSNPSSHQYREVYVLLAAVLIPPLFVFGDHRFIVPIIPVVAIFQATALTSLFSAGRRYFQE